MMNMNNKLQRIWKEEILGYSWHSLSMSGGNDKIIKIFIVSISSHMAHVPTVSPKHEREVLTIISQHMAYIWKWSVSYSETQNYKF